MGEFLPPATLIGAITILAGVVGYLFRLLYNGMREERDHYRDQLMPSVKTLVEALASLNNDLRAIVDTQNAVRDDIRRIRDDLLWRKEKE